MASQRHYHEENEEEEDRDKVEGDWVVLGWPLSVTVSIFPPGNTNNEIQTTTAKINQPDHSISLAIATGPEINV